MVDGTHNRCQKVRRTRRDIKKTYSGKKKAHTYNTNHRDQRAPRDSGLSKTVAGQRPRTRPCSTRIRQTLESLRQGWARRTCSEKEKPDRPDGQGLPRDKRGISRMAHQVTRTRKSVEPTKRHGGLTKKQRAYNKRVNSSRCGHRARYRKPDSSTRG